MFQNDLRKFNEDNMKRLKNKISFSTVLLTLINILFYQNPCFGQNNNVGIGTLTPAPSALLDIDASPANNKGVLVPRITSIERLGIASPANSLLVYDTDFACFFYWNSVTSGWQSLCNSGSGNTGSTGPTGLTGTTGAAGITGNAGLTGATGTIGANGTTGAAGITGNAGLTGATGIIGANGTNGAAGITGNAGLTGATGSIGATGIIGSTGIIGITGSLGITGATGADLETHWKITGNAGTTAGTNFIGTTDANDLVVKTNNTEKMRITSGGNVGIGILSPTTAVEIKGIGNSIFRLQPNLPTEDNVIAFGAASSTINRSKIYASGSLGDINGDLRFAVGLALTPIDPAIIITSNGNVGIGLITPVQKLNVNGNIRIDGNGAFTSVSKQNYLVAFDNSGHQDWYIGDGTSNNNALQIVQDTKGEDIRFTTMDTLGIIPFERMTISGSVNPALNGNVGIGTTSPSAKLEIQGNVKIADGTQGAGKVLTSDAGGLASWQANSSVPAGAVFAFPVVTPPSGYLACEGQAVSRTAYSTLFTLLGTLYGSGDGSTTFNLPDLRGEFIRGYDNGRNVDAGRTIGSPQKSTLQVFDYSTPSLLTLWKDPFFSNESFGADPAAPADYPGVNINYSPGPFSQLPIGSSTPDVTGTVRPRNIAMIYCIKY